MLRKEMMRTVMVVSLWSVCAGLASAAEVKFDMPKEATGFKGTLVGQVAKYKVGDKWSPAGWVAIGEIKVINVANNSKISVADLNKAFSGKFENIGAKDAKVTFPEVKEGDWVSVECYQNEGHLRATKMEKVDAVKLGLEKPDSSKPAPPAK